MKYYIWTEGCQMNSADSLRVAAALENLGYETSAKPESADVIVLNTCVVRQSAEDKAIGRLTSLKSLKISNPDKVINLMGCLVGIRGAAELKERFPYVDVFSQPSDPRPLIDFLSDPKSQEKERQQNIEDILDEEFAYTLPDSRKEQMVSALLPVVFGCSHACSYCVIPLRRGREISRHPDEVLADARSLVSQGVKEIILLGQIVDRYGHDQPGYPHLSGLLRSLHKIEGVERIRFLTSHPNWVSDELLDTVADLPKVMPHFELPIQAGDDSVLQAMRRGYTVEKFMKIVEKIRTRFTTLSIATDLIVGFPGETEAQFKNSVEALETMRPDMTHVARYSPRPGTHSALNLADDVPEDEKKRRFRVIESLQEKITSEINAAYINQRVPVLFEDKHKNRWRGRTPTNKLVFVETDADLKGAVKDVRITWAGPWSMIAEV
ncbi:MAG: tRNA (N6-isopentenyl adenosine(37)-C2)-methylthiotransferase MiaB [Chloroflexi bacterium]|nr:tRNA (N6-isopentenyl adenosine(37)-C2)-methylthiotransferase MiaB [Chloroflexota bacterium]